MSLKISATNAANVTRIVLDGELDASVAGEFKSAVEKAVTQQPRQLVLDMTNLSFMASAGLRVLIFAKQKMGGNVEIVIVGAQESVMDTITMTGFHHSVTIQNSELVPA